MACIFATLKATKTTPAHRELIDLVMSLKATDLISNIDSVSKTKIRGVLALLKHGELLTTQGTLLIIIILFNVRRFKWLYVKVI